MKQCVKMICLASVLANQAVGLSYIEHFDAETGCSNDCTANGVISANFGYNGDLIDDQDWLTHSGAISKANAGPDFNHTTGEGSLYSGSQNSHHFSPYPWTPATRVAQCRNHWANRRPGACA